MIALALPSSPEHDGTRNEHDRDEHIGPKPRARVAGCEVVGDEHLSHVADRVAAVPDDGRNRCRDLEAEVAPECDGTEHADGQIGDAGFELKRAWRLANVLCRVDPKVHVQDKRVNALHSDGQQ